MDNSTTGSIQVAGESIPLDPEGYLVKMSDWSTEVAEALAAREGRVLDERHWEVLRVLRDFYQEYELSPAMRPFTKAVKLALGSDKGSSLYLMKLFPEHDTAESPARIGARLAGLPKPTNCH